MWRTCRVRWRPRACRRRRAPGSAVAQSGRMQPQLVHAPARAARPYPLRVTTARPSDAEAITPMLRPRASAPGSRGRPELRERGRSHVPGPAAASSSSWVWYGLDGEQRGHDEGARRRWRWRTARTRGRRGDAGARRRRLCAPHVARQRGACAPAPVAPRMLLRRPGSCGVVRTAASTRSRMAGGGGAAAGPARRTASSARSLTSAGQRAQPGRCRSKRRSSPGSRASRA